MINPSGETVALDADARISADERPAKKSPDEAKASRGDLPEVVSGANPLVCAANNLLNLIPQLRASTRVSSPSTLREYLIEEIRLFERRAREFGVTEESIVGARYCLCTVADETAAQTPWGGSGIWPTYSLLVKFHNETWGGEKFFMLLSRLAKTRSSTMTCWS